MRFVQVGEERRQSWVPSHEDTEERELGLVRLQEVHQEADGPRETLKQAAEAGR